MPQLPAVSVVIPAYNEATTIAATVQVALGAQPLEVLVVDDGSADETANLAERAGAKVLRLSPNRGKAGALLAGVEAARGSLILMLDADLLHLRPDHLHQLAEPVLRGEANVTVGLFIGSPLHTTAASLLTRQWSGQRCLPRQVFDGLPGDDAHYAIELMLEDRVRELGWKPRYVLLHGIGHRTKEDKLGVYAGLRARLRMFRQLFGYRFGQLFRRKR